MPLREGTEFSILRPDDWHLHLRDGAVLPDILPHTARRFRRAIVMPNLDPPIITTAAAQDYRQRIIGALPMGLSFDPLMTLYLCEQTSRKELRQAKASGIIYGVKLYPAGSTTHSHWGVRNIKGLYPLLAEMERLGLLLLVHAEVTDTDVDIFDREKVFIERHLKDIIKCFPRLKVVFEHITTADAVDFVKSAFPSVAATITAHHLLLNRNALFQNGIRPHHYCLPLLKTEADRQALVKAATSGQDRFFLGSDSAPHAQFAKEGGQGCAGIYTAHCALELYAEVFDSCDALECMEKFASLNGAAFYGLSPNTESVRLIKKKSHIPKDYSFGKERLVPFRAGESVEWSMAE